MHHSIRLHKTGTPRHYTLTRDGQPALGVVWARAWDRWEVETLDGLEVLSAHVSLRSAVRSARGLLA